MIRLQVSRLNDCALVGGGGVVPSSAIVLCETHYRALVLAAPWSRRAVSDGGCSVRLTVRIGGEVEP